MKTNKTKRQQQQKNKTKKNRKRERPENLYSNYRKCCSRFLWAYQRWCFNRKYKSIYNYFIVNKIAFTNPVSPNWLIFGTSVAFLCV